MKVAFHFNESHESIKDAYYGDLYTPFFQACLQYQRLEYSTKVFVGSLLLNLLARDVTNSDNGETLCFNQDKFCFAVSQWAVQCSANFCTLSEAAIEHSLTDEIFVICLESIDLPQAEYLDETLSRHPAYLGASEIDDSSRLHWVLYCQSLVPAFRIIGRKASILWDGIDEDSKPTWHVPALQKAGFSQVIFEDLNGRYTLFDAYHDFDHARRTAEWKKRCGELLSFVADNVVSRLSDSAPLLGDKLWSMINTYERAETDEDYAQVAASCRRILEYVADCLFPPIAEDESLGKGKYKNRLRAFADQSRKSDTNIDVICTSLSAFDEQTDKLLRLVNKGVHAEVYRHEVRRCMLRIVMLIDDIISL